MERKSRASFEVEALGERRMLCGFTNRLIEDLTGEYKGVSSGNVEAELRLSVIHMSEASRALCMSYAVYC